LSRGKTHFSSLQLLHIFYLTPFLINPLKNSQSFKEQLCCGIANKEKQNERLCWRLFWYAKKWDGECVLPILPLKFTV
jgi:hypothetical protein